jgi:hypothetical protein
MTNRDGSGGPPRKGSVFFLTDEQREHLKQIRTEQRLAKVGPQSTNEVFDQMMFVYLRWRAGSLVEAADGVAAGGSLEGSSVRVEELRVALQGLSAALGRIAADGDRILAAHYDERHAHFERLATALIAANHELSEPSLLRMEMHREVRSYLEELIGRSEEEVVDRPWPVRGRYLLARLIQRWTSG